MENNRKGKILTASDVAEILGMTKETVYHLLEKGEIPGRKIGGQWRIAEDELWDYIRQPQK